MAVLKRLRCPWQGGGVVGPSLSTFYFDATATAFPGSVQALFNSVKAYLPDDVNITIPNTGDSINSGDGTLAGIWTDTGGAVVSGTSASAFAIGAGGRIQWLTAGIRGDRRVTGTTFLVPLASSAFDTTGIIPSTPLGVFQTAASALVTAQSGHFVIWGKPHSKAANDGVYNVVVSGLARSTPTGLRTRRT
jgi:hypothetical protein